MQFAGSAREQLQRPLAIDAHIQRGSDFAELGEPQAQGIGALFQNFRTCLAFGFDIASHAIRTRFQFRDGGLITRQRDSYGIGRHLRNQGRQYCLDRTLDPLTDIGIGPA